VDPDGAAARAEERTDGMSWRTSQSIRFAPPLEKNSVAHWAL
jgi:hypothetical protein